MPAESKKQQVAACIAYNAKRGKVSKSSLRGASKKMHDSMTLEQLREYCKRRS